MTLKTCPMPAGLTSLMFAVVNNHIGAAELLLSLGANPYLRNANDESVMDMTRSKQLRDLLLSKTKLKVSEPKWCQIRNSPLKLRKDSSVEKKHKCSLTVSPYTPKRLKFLSPRKLKEKTLKTKTLIWEKFKKRWVIHSKILKFLSPHKLKEKTLKTKLWFGEKNEKEMSHSKRSNVYGVLLNKA